MVHPFARPVRLHILGGAAHCAPRQLILDDGSTLTVTPIATAPIYYDLWRWADAHSDLECYAEWTQFGDPT